MLGWIVLTWTIVLNAISPVARAQDAARSELSDVWIKEKQGSQPFYQSTPVTQVVPNFNTITYAFQSEIINAKITPEEPVFKTGESLTLGGYTAAPHISISLKKVGLGFSGEVGQRSATFYRDGIYNANQDTAQESSMTYRGFGFNAYYILPQPFGKKVKPSLTVGYAAFSAKHSVSTFVYETGEATIDPNQRQSYSYNVGRSSAGLNIGIQLLKKFTLIPWLNYELHDTGEAYQAADKAEASGSQIYAVTLKEDTELFWNAAPRTRYGLNFSVKLFDSLELQIGGLLGAVTSIGREHDQIVDQSYTLAFSFEQNGN